jgi:hypothetical protein
VRRTLMKCTSPVLLLASVLLAHAQDVPVLDIEPVCRGIAQQAATAGERGGPDLGLAQCVKSEQATRERLVKGMVDVRVGRQGQLCWRSEIGSAAELH